MEEKEREGAKIVKVGMVDVKVVQQKKKISRKKKE